jgi:hypothetical protein
MAIWYVLWPFGIFYGNVVILWQFGIIFPVFGTLCQDKSGSPGDYRQREICSVLFAPNKCWM